MTTPTLNGSLRKEAVASIDAVATEIQDAARQELESLRSSMSARLAALERVLTRDRNDPAFDSIIEKLCEAAGDHAEAASTWTRAQAEEVADRQLAAARAQAQADLDAAHASSEARRVELEQRLAESESARLMAALAQAETERTAAAARVEADAAAASLAEARTQIATLEGARTDLMLGLEIAEAHLEGEVHNRNAIAAELEVAREKVLHAKADADACRLQLQRAAARLRALEAQQPHGAESPGATSNEAVAVAGRIRSALQRLSGAATGRGLLDAALEALAENFSRVALCAVTPQGCTVWGSRGFDPPLESRKAVIALAADSPLRRGLADWKPATVRVTDGEGPIGVSGGPIGYAIALPIVAQDKATVMLYAENPPESNGDSSVAEKIAEILADHLGQRLRPRRTAAAAEPYLPARQARRVKIQEGTDVAVDGAHSTLVDLSMLGAQVLSPRAIRPNGSVRLQLPSDAGALSCEARVVWVVTEQGQDRQKPLYRAGVQFTDVGPDLEAFFTQHGIFESPIRH